MKKLKLIIFFDLLIGTQSGNFGTQKFFILKILIHCITKKVSQQHNLFLDSTDFSLETVWGSRGQNKWRLLIKNVLDFGFEAVQNCRPESIVDFSIAAFSNERISKKSWKIIENGLMDFGLPLAQKIKKKRKCVVECSSERKKIDERFHIKFYGKIENLQRLQLLLKIPAKPSENPENPWKFPPPNHGPSSLRKLARVETETCTPKCSKVQSTWWLFAD